MTSNTEQRQAALAEMERRRKSAEDGFVRFLTRLSEFDDEADGFPLVDEFRAVTGQWVAYVDVLLERLEQVDAA